MVYTQSEKVDMLLIYGECRRNGRNARALYAERYPHRNHPSREYFLKVEREFRRPRPGVANDGVVISEDIEINVLAAVEFNRKTSVREIARDLDIGRESVRKILKKHGYKSYKYQIHQALYENDFHRRLQYCRWLLDNELRVPNFQHQIIFSDESRFTNNGMFNRNNARYWSQENHRLVRQGNFQERFGFNVWMGILGNRLIGPIFFDGVLNGERYLNFLTTDIEGFLEDLPINIFNQTFFQQDGAPPHNTRNVTQYLNERFPNCWIGTNGPVQWPARSPDLTPLDFFLWGHLKERVYSTVPTTLENLQQRVREAINAIEPAHLNNVMRETLERARQCIRLDGHHFEQLR